jgi:hypothetical protein
LKVMRTFVFLLIAGCILSVMSCGYVVETDLLSPADVGAFTRKTWTFNVPGEYTADAGIQIAGGTALLSSDFFDTGWLYRMPLLVDNGSNPSSLSGYQVRLALDGTEVDFWNGVESDGRSIRIADEDGVTLIDHFVDSFDYGGMSAVLYAEVPAIPGSSTKTLYLYFGNTSATSTSSGTGTFFFYDDFEAGDLGWQTYASGSVEVISDSGNLVLRKFLNSDPNGGYRTFSSSIGSFEALFRTKRFNFDGGGANRYALEDASFDGYGTQLNNFDASSTTLIEERAGGSATTLGTTLSLSLVSNQWYTLVLRRFGSDLELDIFDESGSPLGSLSRSDGSVSSFDRFIVHGGYEFYTDDIRVRKYSSPDPSLSTGALEKTFLSSGPVVEPNQGQVYEELIGFSHILGTGNQGTVVYQVSNNGLDWYWWNGSGWSAASSLAEANNVSVVNGNISQFVEQVGTGTFYFRAFLLSDGSQRTYLDAVELQYR